jgi:hypothetical protein
MDELMNALADLFQSQLSLFCSPICGGTNEKDDGTTSNAERRRLSAENSGRAKSNTVFSDD